MPKSVKTIVIVTIVYCLIIYSNMQKSTKILKANKNLMKI